MVRKPPSPALPTTLILAMRGSVCLYQGEELGLKEAELAFEDLVDPYGIEFWPQFKGRDGCRTPMVWQAHVRNGAFSTAERTWLPVPADHLTHAVDTQDKVEGSVLEFYRALLAFRKANPALAKGDIALLESTGNILAFTRTLGNESLLCVFNMGETAAEFVIPAGPRPPRHRLPRRHRRPYGWRTRPRTLRLLYRPAGIGRRLFLSPSRRGRPMRLKRSRGTIFLRWLPNFRLKLSHCFYSIFTGTSQEVPRGCNARVTVNRSCRVVRQVRLWL